MTRSIDTLEKVRNLPFQSINYHGLQAYVSNLYTQGWEINSWENIFSGSVTYRIANPKENVRMLISIKFPKEAALQGHKNLITPGCVTPDHIIQGYGRKHKKPAFKLEPMGEADENMMLDYLLAKHPAKKRRKSSVGNLPEYLEKQGYKEMLITN